jgi:uncharacterized protein YbaR (Trm112 family)
MPVHTDLLDLIRCPRCRGVLTLRSASSAGGGEWLACAACGVRYPVVDDIPQLLIEEAKPLEA